MRRIYFILIIFALLACEQQPMKISQVEDDYAKQNGGIPNENVFLIECFKNNKESIKAIVDYVQDTVVKMMPFKNPTSSCKFIFDRDDVDFEDGDYRISSKTSLSFFINEKETDYLEAIHIFRGKRLPYVLQGDSTVVINYKTFTLNVLKTFLEAVEKERDKIGYNYDTDQFEIAGEKLLTFKKTYRLLNARDSTVSCVINYVKKGNFTIDFPEHPFETEIIYESEDKITPKQ